MCSKHEKPAKVAGTASVYGACSYLQPVRAVAPHDAGAGNLPQQSRAAYSLPQP